MESLAGNFDDALVRIAVGARQKVAQDAHKEVRSVLEGSTALKDWGIDTILIGSYARTTSIYPGKDVDVFSKLTKLNTDASPTGVFNTLSEALIDHYGKRAEKQRRSVKIDFDDGEFGVDVVPAVSAGSHWAIPNRDRATWESDGRWIKTDPEQLSSLTTQCNSSLSVAGQGAYVPTVKLVRQIREHHLGDRDPGGLYFELMTYWAFQSEMYGTCFAEILARTLRSIAGQLSNASSIPLIDPALVQSFSPCPDSGDLEKAAEEFDELAGMAEQALDAEKCPAAALWRKILGENGNGWCFTLPDGCDETGKEIGPVIPVRSQGSSEARGFG
jgi:hypothetical protein